MGAHVGMGHGTLMSTVLARTYPMEVTATEYPDSSSLLVVLVEDSIGEYAAYRGEPNGVVRYGDKLSFDEACRHFPRLQLEAGKYRR